MSPAKSIWLIRRRAAQNLVHLTVGLAHPDYARGGGGFGGGGAGRFGAGAGTNPSTLPTGARAGFGRRGGAATNPSGAPGGFAGGFGGRGGGPPSGWDHDAKHYQFWNDGAEDGNFTITKVRPGNYTLHAFADGVLGEFAQTNITVEAGKTLDLANLDWKPVRYGKQIWDIGYPDRTGGKFFKGDGDNYWLWGWPLRYSLLFPKDITYTIGQSDYHKDWFFEEVPHSESTAWIQPRC